MTPFETKVAGFYDDLAASGKLMIKNPGFWREEFNLLTKRGTPVFFDLGCGDGRETQLYYATFGSLDGYFGLDLSSGMLKYVKSLAPEAKLVRANLNQLPFAADSLPIVWAAASYLHIGREQIKSALAELFRVMAKDGHGFISLKTAPQNPDYNRELVTYHELAEFGQFLKGAGFDVTHMFSDPVRDPRGVTWLGFFFTKPQ